MKTRLLLVDTVEKYIGPMTPLQDWKRAQNYLYRDSRGDKKLSVKQVKKVLEFLLRHLEPELVRHIVQSMPQIFRKSVSTQLEMTWQFLNSCTSSFVEFFIGKQSHATHYFLGIVVNWKYRMWRFYCKAVRQVFWVSMWNTIWLQR